jgi:hypothetical protein
LATLLFAPRVLDDLDRLAKFLVEQSRSGYIAPYRYDPAADAVLVLRVRHLREGGFDET